MGPQGEYKPFWYFVKTRLLTFEDLKKLHGISREDYQKYVREEWERVTVEQRHNLKYECRLKNVLECIMGIGKNENDVARRLAKIKAKVQEGPSENHCIMIG